MRNLWNPAGCGRCPGFDRDSRMQTVIIVIHLMVVLAMTGVVLLQRSEGGGLGMGNTGGFLTSRGSANVLTRTTATLAAVFFATSLVLSILAGWDRKPHSILEGAPATQPARPAGGPQPLAPGGRAGRDTLRQPGDPPARQRAAARARHLHPSHLVAVHPELRRDQDQTDPALGQRAALDRHPAGHSAVPDRPADPAGRAAQALAVLQCARKRRHRG